MAGARHYSQLIVWQLADALRGEIFRLTAKAPFHQDFKARSQIDDAASSVCRNVAEGFGCDTHREFARFLTIARRSLNEVFDCLRGAEQHGYVTPEDLTTSRALARRLVPAMSRLLEHLRKTEGRPARATLGHRVATTRQTASNHVDADGE